MDFSSGITVVNSVSRRTSVVSSVNHNKRVLFKKKEKKKYLPMKWSLKETIML